MVAALPEPDERAGCSRSSRELVPDELYRHPLRTELSWTRLRS